MLREKKLGFVEEMKADLDRCQAIVFVDFTGLTVAEADRFRSKMREAEVTYRVVKNTLMKRVIAGTSYEEASQWLKGTPTGVAYSFEDPVAPARVTYEFLEECNHIKVKGGMLDNRAISDKETEDLSKMPSRSEMQAQVLGMILGVAGGLIAQVKSPAGRIVGAVEAKAKQDNE